MSVYQVVQQHHANENRWLNFFCLRVAGTFHFPRDQTSFTDCLSYFNEEEKKKKKKHEVRKWSDRSWAEHANQQQRIVWRDEVKNKNASEKMCEAKRMYTAFLLWLQIWSNSQLLPPQIPIPDLKIKNVSELKTGI